MFGGRNLQFFFSKKPDLESEKFLKVSSETYLDSVQIRYNFLLCTLRRPSSVVVLGIFPNRSSVALITPDFWRFKPWNKIIKQIIIKMCFFVKKVDPLEIERLYQMVQKFALVFMLQEIIWSLIKVEDPTNQRTPSEFDVLGWE